MTRADLAREVTAACIARGWVWRKDLQTAAGLNHRTVTKVVKAEGGGVSQASLLAIDRALEWVPGTAQRIQDHGGDPVLVGNVTAEVKADPMFLDIPRAVIDSLTDAELVEARAASSAAFLARVREMRRGSAEC